MKILLKKISLYLLLLMSFSGANSYATEPATDLLKNELSNSVKNLYLGKHGKEYPYDQSALDRCLNDHYQPCLRVYNKVKKAKENILSMPSNAALSTILNLIQESCNSEDEIQANYVCHGSIMALYFYNDKNHDIKILSAIKSYNKATKNIIFNNNFSWFRNRSNKSDWANYLTSEDISWDQEGSKKEVINMFLSSPEPSPLWSRR